MLLQQDFSMCIGEIDLCIMIWHCITFGVILDAQFMIDSSSL